MAITWNEEEVANTISRYKKIMTDNILGDNALLFMMKKNGNINMANGGTTLGHEIILNENNQGKWFHGYEQQNTGSTPVMTRATYDWKQYSIPVLLSGREENINSGAVTQKHNLLKGKIMAAESSMSNAIATSMFSDGTGTSGKELTGLQALVADDPTTGVVGTINRANEVNWRNQLYDFSTESVTPGSDTIVGAMNSLWNRCTFGNDTPNLIVAGTTYFEFYENALVSTLQTNKPASSKITKALADAGFTVIEYKGVPCVLDKNCSATRMYMLNTKHLFFEAHPNANFSLGKVRAALDQDAVLYPINFMGNLTMNSARTQGVMIA